MSLRVLPPLEGSCQNSRVSLASPTSAHLPVARRTAAGTTLLSAEPLSMQSCRSCEEKWMEGSTASPCFACKALRARPSRWPTPSTLITLSRAAILSTSATIITILVALSSSFLLLILTSIITLPKTLPFRMFAPLEKQFSALLMAASAARSKSRQHPSCPGSSRKKSTTESRAKRTCERDSRGEEALSLRSVGQARTATTLKPSEALA
mmetsp:Transcript_8382/g.25134  ORF Transcript_8382/g.25134 Transcript_8382/m.25134 type:complete len:209 (-) Transcript_8382:1309-1935(-)